MKLKNLEIKDLVIGGIITILHFPFPYVDRIQYFNDYLFLIGFITLIASNLIPKKFSMMSRIYIYGFDFPFFKLGLLLTIAALIMVPLGMGDNVKINTILFAFLILLVSLFFERQELIIFKDGDAGRYKSWFKVMCLLGVLTFIFVPLHWAFNTTIINVLAYASFFSSLLGITFIVIWFIVRLFQMRWI